MNDRGLRMLIRRNGVAVVLRRPLPTQPVTYATAVVRGLERPFGVHELIGAIAQGDHQVIVARADLEGAGFPVPVLRGDTVVLDPVLVGGVWQRGSGRSLHVQDPGPRGGIGFWIQARG